jgi:hypothetical protein
MTIRNFAKKSKTKPANLADQRLAETLALTALLPVSTDQEGDGLQCRIPSTSSTPSPASLPHPITPNHLRYEALPNALAVSVANQHQKLLDVFAPGVPTNRIRRVVKETLQHQVMYVPLEAMLGLCKSWGSLNPFQKALLVAGSELTKKRKAWALTLNLSEDQQARAAAGVAAGKPLSVSMEREMRMLAGLGTVVACLELTEADKRPHLHVLCFTEASRDTIRSTIRQAAHIRRIDPKARKWHCDRREAVFPPGWLDYMFKGFNRRNPMSKSSVYISNDGKAGGKAFGGVLKGRVDALFRRRQGTQGKSLALSPAVRGRSLTDHLLAPLLPPAWLPGATH